MEHFCGYESGVHKDRPRSRRLLACGVHTSYSFGDQAWLHFTYQHSHRLSLVMGKVGAWSCCLCGKHLRSIGVQSQEMTE